MSLTTDFFLKAKAQEKNLRHYSAFKNLEWIAQWVELIASNAEDLSDAGYPHDRKRELTPASCSLTSIKAL